MMKTPITRRVKFISFIIIVFILCLVVGSGFSKDSTSGNAEIFEGLQLFAEVLTKIQDNYVEEVTPKKLVYGAIRGMIQTLDPYSQFMDTDQYNELEVDTKGEFGGIGIRIIMEDNWLTVDSPMEGTPAFRVGIKAKDRIIRINDDSTEGISLEDAVKKLRGPKGSQVKLGIFRPGTKEPLSFNIIRDIIIIESIRSKVFDKHIKIGYIRITEFREKTAEDLIKALHNLEKEGIQGLILDLRYNPGGLLKSAVEVSDIFLPADKVIVSTKGRASGQDQEFHTSDSKDKFLKIPMVCLINDMSASASEIVAGALQDHKRAILVGPQGKKTFGKGSVQSVMELRDNTALRLTTAKYYTPSGKSIHGDGLEGDINVEVSKEVEESMMVSGKLGDLTFPKVTRTLQEDSTYKYIPSETETIEDVQLVQAMNILNISDYFKQPGIVNIPETKSSITTAQHTTDILTTAHSTKNAVEHKLNISPHP